MATLTADLDAPEEVLEAALSFLQAEEAPALQALPHTAATLEVRFHRCGRTFGKPAQDQPCFNQKPNPPPTNRPIDQLQPINQSPARLTAKQLAGNWPVVAGLLRSKARCYSGTYKAHMPALVAATGLAPSELVSQLSQLAGAKEVSFDLGRQQALAWKVRGRGCCGVDRGKTPLAMRATPHPHHQPHPHLCLTPNATTKPNHRTRRQVLRTPADLPALAAQLSARLARVVVATVARLDAAYAAIAGAAAYGGDAAAQERHLRGAIRDYFGQHAAAEGEAAAAGGGAGGGPHADGEGGGGGDAEMADAQEAAGPGGPGGVDAAQADAWEMVWGGDSPVQRPGPDQLRRNVRGFLRAEAARLRAVGHEKLSGLAVARLMAGLGSAAFPSDQWRKVTEWGRLQAVDFPLLVAAADAELPALWED